MNWKALTVLGLTTVLVALLTILNPFVLPEERVWAWSDPATWDGAPPGADANVTIPRGKRVVLDRSVRLNTLTVLGGLEFARQNLELRARWIVVADGGLLQIGSEAAPFKERATITLTGQDSAEDVMGVGTKFLAAMRGGRLELHGEARTAWTHLASDAPPGARQIRLGANHSWRSGDRLIIASSDERMNHAETVTVTGVAGAVLTVSPALRYAHSGQTRRIAGLDVDERAEVALLNRQVKIRGDTASTQSGFGGQIMVMDRGSSARLSNVELERMGQAGKLKRYGLHYHEIFDDGQNSIIRDSSLHQNFNRCIVVHGTNGLTVERNTCVDTIGHAFYIEDGAETGNRLIGNLGVLTRAPAPHHAVVPSDLPSPATFWITNPRNVLHGNVSAGSDGYGFWFVMPVTRIGVTAREAPGEYRRLPFSEEWQFDFSNNTAHAGRIGLALDGCVAADFSIFSCRYGRVAERRARSLGLEPGALIDMSTGSFTAYRNAVGAIVRGQNLRLNDLRLAENRVALKLDCQRCEVLGGLASGDPLVSGSMAAGHMTGYWLESGPLKLNGIRFAEFSAPALVFAAGSGANGATSLEGLRFAQTPAVYRVTHQDAAGLNLRDLDGSLTGTPGSLIGQSQALPQSACRWRNGWKLQVCPVGAAHPGFMQVRANDDQPIIGVRRDDGVTARVPRGQAAMFDPTRPNRFEFSAPPQPGTQLEFFDAPAGTSWRFEMPLARPPTLVQRLEANRTERLVAVSSPAALRENSFFYAPDTRTLTVWVGPDASADALRWGSVRLELR